MRDAGHSGRVKAGKRASFSAWKACFSFFSENCSDLAQAAETLCADSSRGMCQFADF
jgi:hypothetical protein